MAETERKPPLKLSDASLDCIIEMAGYGIGYWGVSAVQDDDARTYTITENEEGENAVHVLSYEKLEATFWMLADSWQPLSVNSTIRSYFFEAVSDGLAEGKGDIDSGHMDSDAADVLMQFACFGKLVYG
jgi:hypothetical protein